MKRVILHEEATREIEHEIAYYNTQVPGLGDEFGDVIESALDKIATMPKVFSPYKGRYRRYVERKFSHSIFFVEFDEYIWVATVYHGRREPDRWMDRMPPIGAN